MYCKLCPIQIWIWVLVLFIFLTLYGQTIIIRLALTLLFPLCDPHFEHHWSTGLSRGLFFLQNNSTIAGVGSISVVGKVLVVTFDFMNNSLLYWCPEVLLICLSLSVAFSFGSQAVPKVHLKARIYASVPDPLMCLWGSLIHIEKWPPLIFSPQTCPDRTLQGQALTREH